MTKSTTSEKFAKLWAKLTKPITATIGGRTFTFTALAVIAVLALLATLTSCGPTNTGYAASNPGYDVNDHDEPTYAPAENNEPKREEPKREPEKVLK